ncbi:BatA domain-containing protein [Spirosoma agri]|uniref:Aerotolerance regulator N-terminal domain-containing protein n=1 Tax=Spirosoma agri TaxID=1987381 RepID=A0A6M0IHW8_9BACT|nr:BatA domain-containing protein [Spirosoma agri]NEU67866.1 hypothetical protein [Spirosoma agri]
MTFVEPYLLWGALAVMIPIIIHFWHQKKGKPLAWAATQWLVEKDQQQQRGLKLDNLLLLVLRCLLLVVLAFLLSQPVLTLKTKADHQAIHLIQPSALVTTNFRFELEEAAKRGEKLYWINEMAASVEKPGELPDKQTFTPLLLQSAIDKLRQENTELHLYVLNNEALATVPSIYVPSQYHVHALADSTRKPRAYLATKGNKRLFINQAGRLTSGEGPDPAIVFQSAAAHSGRLTVLLDYRTKREQQTVEAALKALSDVYDLDLVIDHNKIASTTYDWVLTDQEPAKPAGQTLYIVSGKSGYPVVPNVLYYPYSFTPQTDERVANGQLPEWLGEQLIQHYGLQASSLPLSQQELNALFVVSSRSDHKPQTVVHNAILLLFVVLLIAERWIALTKNA